MDFKKLFIWLAGFVIFLYPVIVGLNSCVWGVNKLIVLSFYVYTFLYLDVYKLCLCFFLEFCCSHNLYHTYIAIFINITIYLISNFSAFQVSSDSCPTNSTVPQRTRQESRGCISTASASELDCSVRWVFSHSSYLVIQLGISLNKSLRQTEKSQFWILKK